MLPAALSSSARADQLQVTVACGFEASVPSDENSKNLVSKGMSQEENHFFTIMWRQEDSCSDAREKAACGLLHPPPPRPKVNCSCGPGCALAFFLFLV